MKHKKTLFKKKYIPLINEETKTKNFRMIIFIALFFLTCIFIIKLFKSEIIEKQTIVKNKSFTSKNSLKSKKSDEEFINNLKNILKDDELLIENEMLNKHSTFRIGGPAKYFVKPKKIEQIVEIIKLCNEYKVYYFILGNGSNLLVSDNGFNGVIIQIHEYNFSKLEILKEDENTYILKVGAGMLMKNLAIETCLLSLTGLEDIIDIPGTVGGGIIMNASYKGSGLKIPLISVKAITPKGQIIELSKNECELGSRTSFLKRKKYIVIEATFKLIKGDQMKIQKAMTENTRMRYQNQPMYFGSAGSFFLWDHSKNGGLYEKYVENNLVGYRVGNTMLYTNNTAFIVNLGNGTANDVMEIVNKIEKIFKNKYNIDMKKEVIVIGTIKNIDYYDLNVFEI